MLPWLRVVKEKRREQQQAPGLAAYQRSQSISLQLQRLQEFSKTNPNPEDAWKINFSVQVAINFAPNQQTSNNRPSHVQQHHDDEDVIPQNKEQPTARLPTEHWMLLLCPGFVSVAR